jgi:PEP-CTERM motif
MSIHSEGVSSLKRVASLGAWLAMSGMLLLPVQGMAQNYSLSDGGSTATLNLGAGTGNLGMNSWTVLSGQNQLDQQWFWYSVNGSAPQPINAIGGLSTTANGNNDLIVTYQNSLLSVNVDYTLNGNGVSSGSADIMEYIWINNVSPDQILNVSFFQYSNFNLLQNHNNTVSISGSPGAYTGAFQSTGTPGGSGIAEVILAPSANHGETALVPTTLNELNNPANTNYFSLSDNTSAVTGAVSWAFQWDTTLNPGDEIDMIKDKGLKVTVVPEPTSMTLIALGIGALGLARRRQ